jgi:hypothetical protein
MKANGVQRCPWLSGIFLCAIVGSAHAQRVDTIRSSGSVPGASASHAIHIALWAERGFLETPVQENRIEFGRDGRYDFVVTTGRWAVRSAARAHPNVIPWSERRGILPRR